MTTPRVKAITVSRIYTLPKPLPGSPHFVSYTERQRLRPNTRGPSLWTCNCCGSRYPGHTRPHRIRRRARTSEEYRENYNSPATATLCSGCASQQRLCPICGYWHHRGDIEYRMVKVKVGNKPIQNMEVCFTCYNKHYYNCSGCGELHNRPPAAVVGLNNYCARCHADFPHCDECGTAFPPGDRRTVGGRVFCESCYTSWIPRVESYNYKPTPRFHTMRGQSYVLSELGPKPELYMGVELEIDDGKRGRKLTDALRTYPHLYVKHDGSLSELGIEIVSHPATLEAHRGMYQWGRILRMCKSFGYKSFDARKSCGLHVHINRSFLDPRYEPGVVVPDGVMSTILLKMVTFLYGHMELFSLLAQRESNQYASMFSVTGLKDVMTLKSSFLLKPPPTELNRYQALNFKNANTVEWRIFKGTLNHDSFMAILELVDAATRFILQASVPNLLQQRQSWLDFQTYIMQERKNYRYLIEYMRERKAWIEG